jgi:hypothetical protein
MVVIVVVMVVVVVIMVAHAVRIRKIRAMSRQRLC